MNLIARGSPGEVTFRAAAVLGTIPWQQRQEPTRATHQVKERYGAAKLKMIYDDRGELNAEFGAAMSVWAAGFPPSA